MCARPRSQQPRLPRPSTPVERIVKCEFAGVAATAKDPIYPTMPALKKSGSAAAASGTKSTLASDYRLAVTAMRLAQERGGDAPEWKMRKFAGVKAKIGRDGTPAGVPEVGSP